MAIVQLPLRYGLSLAEIFQVAKTAGLDKQSRRETVDCWDMVQIWQDQIVANFGVITGIQHKSGGDDPPDLELIFEDRTVGFEHTRLLPTHLGQAEFLMREAPEGGAIPPISSQPKDLAETWDIIVGVKNVFEPVTEKWNAIIDLLIARLHTKIRGQPKGGIIGMVHDLVMGDEEHRLLAEFARDIVNSGRFSNFDPFTLILLNRWNMFRFHSALINRGKDILERSR